MRQEWQGDRSAAPIVEFHDIRAEAGQADAYVRLLEGPLADPLVRAGGVMLGQFRVAGHPDRMMVLRGYAHPAARRRALEAFHESALWQRHRAELSGLERDANVLLTRAVAPSSGTRPLRPGRPVTAIVSELRFAEQVGTFHLLSRLLLRKAGLDPLAAFATLEQDNDVPAVPVLRHRTHHVALIPHRGGPPQLPPELRDMLRHAPEILDLEPVPALVW